MFEILDHPADIGIKVYGTTFLITDPETIEPKTNKKITLICRKP